ncbi:MAG: ATPase, T2SS/T4P/T4SS family [archaeon]|nr:ATPase, T2SS/T4P/T4SS family [archaeon]
MAKQTVLESYKLQVDDVALEVNITDNKESFVREYFLDIPEYGPGTKALLETLKKTIISDTSIQTEKMLDPKFIQSLKDKFGMKARSVLSRELPDSSPETINTLIGLLMQEMLGLGKIEFLLGDNHLEEVVINSSKEPAWVYHKKHGWLRTNVQIETEAEIQNYSAIIARRVGKQITTLSPLLDAHLITGDRANATLYPISSKGNTITIRKFRREPWTVTDFIKNKTGNSEMLALLWLSIEFELNVLISGGTASGKTSFLNILMPFIQPNHRIISIEDSVIGETQIVCERNGKFERTTVGEIIDNAIGDNSIEDISLENNSELKLFSMNKEGKIELKEPSKFFRHKVKKKLIDLEFESGKNISVTADHSLFSLGKNLQIEAVAGKDIAKGSFIATPRILEYESNPVIFNLSEQLGVFKNAFVKSNEMSIVIQKNKEALTHLGKSKLQHSRREGIMNAPIVALLAEKPTDFTISSKYGSFLPMNVEIDEDLSTVIGLWLADGCYDINSVLFSVVEPECREVIERIAKRYNINVKMHSDGITLMLNSTVFKTFFEQVLQLRGNAYTKRIPAWAFNLPKKEMAGLLRGYFSGDGWQRKSDAAIRSASMELLEDTQTMLSRFGIQFRFTRKRLKDKTFEARISESVNLKRFYENVGFLQPKKTEKLLHACKRKVHEVSDTIPLPRETLIGIRKKIGNIKAWKNWQRDLKNGHVSRNKLKQIASDYPQLDGLKNLAENEIFWDKVKEVKEREFEGFVYDFSVSQNESFVAENIVCHNTREIELPEFMHWVPLTTREPNSEGKGSVQMIDLLVNSLRMRPDRLIVGEIRRDREAELLFEGMHTGHSAYTTVHANTAEETIRRLTNPPINIPTTMLDAVHLNVVMFRNRRIGARRVLQLAEFVSEKRSTDQESIKPNILYRWKASTDDIVKHTESIRLFDELSLHTGLTAYEINDALKRKQAILDWLVKNNIRRITDVGMVMAEYYKDSSLIEELATKNKKPDFFKEVKGIETKEDNSF